MWLCTLYLLMALGMMCLPKSDQVVVEALDERLAVENVDAHGRQEVFGVRGQAGLAEAGLAHAERVEQGGFLGFFLEPGDAAGVVGFQDAEAGGVGAADREGGDGEVGLGGQVVAQDLAEIHAVELVAAEDEEIFVVALEEIAQVLAHGVGGALVPGRVHRRLLGGQDLDEGRRKTGRTCRSG